MTFSIRKNRGVLLPWPLEKLNDNRLLLMKILMVVINSGNIKNIMLITQKSFVFLVLAFILVPSENELL